MPGGTTYKIGDKISITSGQKVVKAGKWGKDDQGKSKYTQSTYKYPIYEWNGENWITTNQFTEEGVKLTKDPSKQHVNHFADINAVPKAMKASELQSKEWGAANISKDDFIDPATGEQRSLLEVARLLDPKLPNITGKNLINQIRDMAPKYADIAKKEAKQKGFAKEARKKDVYGLQKEAGKAGAAMRGAYGGMGGGMRAGIGAGAGIAKEFEFAQQAYGKDIYGIEQKAAGEYEGEVESFLETDWFTTPESGAKKLTQWDEYTTPTMRGGGRVPKRGETFLDILAQLPEAGGS